MLNMKWSDSVSKWEGSTNNALQTIAGEVWFKESVTAYGYKHVERSSKLNNEGQVCNLGETSYQVVFYLHKFSTLEEDMSLASYMFLLSIV